MCWLYFKRKVIVLYIILRSGRTRPHVLPSTFTAGRHCVYGLSVDYLKHTVLSISRRCFMRRGWGKNTLSLSFETHNPSVFYLCVRKVNVARPSKMSIRCYYYYTGKCQLQRPFASKGQRPFRAIFIKTNRRIITMGFLRFRTRRSLIFKRTLGLQTVFKRRSVRPLLTRAFRLDYFSKPICN